MKKLFLLPVIALIAVMAISSVSAALYCCYASDDCSGGASGPYTGIGCSSTCGPNLNYPSVYSCTPGIDLSTCATSPCVSVPEFTTIGAGIALAGAGLGFALIRRKRK